MFYEKDSDLLVKDSDVLVTVGKLIMISLMELFKNLVPRDTISDCQLAREKEKKCIKQYLSYDIVSRRDIMPCI